MLKYVKHFVELCLCIVLVSFTDVYSLFLLLQVTDYVFVMLHYCVF